MATPDRRVIAAFGGLALAALLSGCGARRYDDDVPILLFTGTGTSPGDVAAIEALLETNHLLYVTASSAQVNAMGGEQLRRHGLLIVPGGNFVAMGNSLTPRAAGTIHDAVQRGLNYLGICAGAFLAGSFPRPYNSMNLTAGVQFGFYDAVRRVHKTVVPIAVAGGPTLDQYWEDGPQLTGWGAVVAKYPDGTPAVAQGTFGDGWVILTGIHPEAPESWRGGLSFVTPASTDNAFAARLIQAALTRTPLSHF